MLAWVSASSHVMGSSPHSDCANRPPVDFGPNRVVLRNADRSNDAPEASVCTQGGDGAAAEEPPGRPASRPSSSQPTCRIVFLILL